MVEGRTKTWFGLVALSGVLALATMGRPWRWRILLASVLVAPLLFGDSLPLALQFSQALLLFAGGRGGPCPFRSRVVDA